MIYQLKSDLDGVKEVLDNFGIALPNLTKRVLGKAGLGTKQSIKKSFGNYFRKRTGRLYKAVKYKMRKSGNSVAIYSDTTSDGTSRGIKYGYVLAAGGTILPKNSNYLTFLNHSGEWKKVKSITLEPRRWVETPFESYIGSEKYSADIETIIQQQLDKYFK